MKLGYSVIIILIAIFSSFHSCKTEVTKRKDYLEVMKVHDEAMARMGEIYELKRSLSETLESSQDSLHINKVNAIIEKLEYADEGMMDWMASFRIPENEDEESLKLYFLSEQKAVNTVSKNINSAIEQANDFLNQKKIQ